MEENKEITVEVRTSIQRQAIKPFEQSLVDFLHYVESSKAEDMPENCDERLMRLHEVIESIKANSEMEAAYMKAETREREIIADAKQEGRELVNSLVQKLIEDGRVDELALSVKDKEMQDKLLKEYGLQ